MDNKANNNSNNNGGIKIVGLNTNSIPDSKSNSKDTPKFDVSPFSNKMNQLNPNFLNLPSPAKRNRGNEIDQDKRETADCEAIAKSQQMFGNLEDINPNLKRYMDDNGDDFPPKKSAFRENKSPRKKTKKKTNIQAESPKKEKKIIEIDDSDDEMKDDFDD